MRHSVSHKSAGTLIILASLLLLSCSKPKITEMTVLTTSAPAITTTPPPTSSPEPASAYSPSIQSNIGSGSFNQEIIVEISAGVGSTIYYCLDTGVPCDPLTDGVIYTGAIDIGDNGQEGDYTLSFVEVFPDNTHSDVITEHYTINSSLPNLTLNFPSIYLQTAQKDRISRMTSSLMGQNNLSFSLLNTGTSDTAIDCDSYLTSFPPASFGLLSNASNKISDLSTYLLGDYINFALNASGNLTYGNNYLVGVLSDNNDAQNPRRACQRQNIILRDFTFFTNESSIAEEDTFSGAFVNYASPTYVGGENIFLKSSFIEVVK